MSRRWPIDPADVALGTLESDQQAAADRLLRSDPQFRVEVERLSRVGAMLAEAPDEAWRPPAPPPLDLDAALRVRPAAGGTTASRRSGRRRLVLRPALAAFAALALLAVGVGGGLLLSSGDDQPPVAAAMTVELGPVPGDATTTQRATVQMPARAGGEATLDASDLPPSHAGEYYEAWLMSDAKTLVSLGTFQVGADGRANVRFPVGVDPSAYRYVDVSLERDDGNPGHSGTSVLRSPALT